LKGKSKREDNEKIRMRRHGEGGGEGEKRDMRRRYSFDEDLKKDR